MGHTEGKWKIHKTNKSSCHIYVGSEGNEVILAAVQNQDFKANAHLIAAAPDLLAACEMMVSGLNNLNDDANDEIHAAEILMTAAIAAAKGGE